MALPKIDLPLFQITIPSTGKKTTFRPFTVKEEKIMLIARESKDIDQIILSVKQIINNCVEGVDVEKLAVFDIEYLMINIRSKSVSNDVSFSIKDPDTNETVMLNFDIEKVNITKNPEHNPVIQINDTYHVKMRYPTINELKTLAAANEGKQTEAVFSIMMSCIEAIMTEDQVYKLEEFSDKEVADFIDSLSTTTVQLIQKFFETMPQMRIELPYKTKEGVTKTFVIQGVETFFI